MASLLDIKRWSQASTEIQAKSATLNVTLQKLLLSSTFCFPFESMQKHIWYFETFIYPLSPCVMHKAICETRYCNWIPHLFSPLSHSSCSSPHLLSSSLSLSLPLSSFLLPSISTLCFVLLLPFPQNTNVTTLEVGPQNLILQDNHKLVNGPLPFIKIQPGHYCIVNNPIDRR